MYRWFLIVYQISYVLGIVGYLVLLSVFTGLAFLLPISPDWVLELAVTLVFYGVYFGVMGRDCAEVCVDYMAASMTVSITAVTIKYHTCTCIAGNFPMVQIFAYFEHINCVKIKAYKTFWPRL